MFSHLRLCGHKLSTCDFLKTFSKICFTSRNEKIWLKPNLSMFQRLKTSLKETISLTPMDCFVNYIQELRSKKFMDTNNFIQNNGAIFRSMIFQYRV